MQHGGRVICLWAEPDAILARLSDKTDRPLLAGDDRAAKLRDLLKQREEVYRSFAWQIDTTKMDVAEVMLHVMALYGSISELRRTGYVLSADGRARQCRFCWARDCWSRSGRCCARAACAARVALIGDSNVIAHARRSRLSIVDDVGL